MEKLPKKEELLPKQETVKHESPKGDSNAVKSAKEAADIAASRDKEQEFEIKSKLRKQGYESWEEAKANIETQKQEAHKMLESAKQIENSAVKLREEAEEDKEKAIRAFEIVKQRELTVNERLERAIKIETSINESDERHVVLKQELLDLINYYHKNTAPCVRVLGGVSGAIYSYMEQLNNTKYDFSLLYNYIGRVMVVVDKYVEKMPSSLPKNILPKE